MSRKLGVRRSSVVTSPAAAAIVNVLRFISSLLVRGRAIPPDGMKLGTHPDIRVEPVLPLCNLPIVAPFGMRRPGEQRRLAITWVGSCQHCNRRTGPGRLGAVSRSLGLIRITDRPIFRAAIVCIVVLCPRPAKRRKRLLWNNVAFPDTIRNYPRSDCRLTVAGPPAARLTHGSPHD